MNEKNSKIKDLNLWSWFNRADFKKRNPNDKLLASLRSNV